MKCVVKCCSRQFKLGKTREGERGASVKTSPFPHFNFRVFAPYLVAFAMRYILFSSPLFFYCKCYRILQDIFVVVPAPVSLGIPLSTNSPATCRIPTPFSPEFTPPRLVPQSTEPDPCFSNNSLRLEIQRKVYYI